MEQGRQKKVDFFAQKKILLFVFFKDSPAKDRYFVQTSLFKFSIIVVYMELNRFSASFLSLNPDGRLSTFWRYILALERSFFF